MGPLLNYFDQLCCLLKLSQHRLALSVQLSLLLPLGNAHFRTGKMLLYIGETDVISFNRLGVLKSIFHFGDKN